MGAFARVAFGWAPEKTLSDTAWLNGLRGLAALLVAMSHWSNAFLSPVVEAPFGAVILEDTAFSNVWYFYKDQRLWAPWRLPIVRILISNGGGQVAIFFIISGFVLTCNFLGETDFAKLHVSLGSSTLRRWSRLYLPCVIVTFIYVLVENFKHLDRGVGAFFGDIWAYVGDSTTWMMPFLRPRETVFANMHAVNLVVWTIPYEFSGSIFVFVLVLCLSRVPFKRRIFVVLFVTVYALWAWRWELWLFGTGMALADYTRHAKLFTKTHTPFSSVLWSICLVLGLLILSFPSELKSNTRPGYDEVNNILPFTKMFRDHVGDDHIWWGTGATLIVTSMCHLRPVRRFFELPVLQHLGKISFMLYLIHPLLGHNTGYAIQMAIYEAICTEEKDATFDNICKINSLLNVTIVLACWLISIPPLLMAAHFLEISVDRPVTKWSKTMDRLLVHGFSKKDKQVGLSEVEEEHLPRSRDLEMQEVSSESDRVDAEQEHLLSSSEDFEKEDIKSETGRRSP